MTQHSRKAVSKSPWIDWCTSVYDTSNRNPKYKNIARSVRFKAILQHEGPAYRAHYGIKYYLPVTKKKTGTKAKTKKMRRISKKNRISTGGVAIYKFNAQTQRFLDSYGHIPINSITLCKEPIQSFVSTALSVVTFGLFDKAKKKMGYDAMYHVFALLEGEDQGRKGTFFIEKNQTILAGVANASYLKAEKTLKVTMPRPMTINEMVTSTRNRMGTEHFYDYRGYDWNCQDFLINFLEANGMLTQGARDFLFQDTKAMFDDMPGVFKPISKAVTDLAGIYDFATKK